MAAFYIVGNNKTNDMKKELTKLDLNSYEFSMEAKKYLAKNKVKELENGRKIFKIFKRRIKEK
ncbi:hypothetical protein H8D04_00065 [bacterium]|nr:hypothetical protein [bacterium]